MNPWPSRDFLDCLGWTLLHFLWQGLLIAALLAVALGLLRRYSASLRYLAGCFALLLLTLAPVATFYSLKQAGAGPAPKFVVMNTVVADSAVEMPSLNTAPQPVLTIASKPVLHKITLAERLEVSLPWLVGIWMFGVFALSCRLFAGWLLIQRLRRTASAAILDAWQTKLKELARRVGVSRSLRLLQSAGVEVPTVIGWLRPVILLPASCLLGLTPSQLESILIHELAHIRRHDYLVNLVQNVVETLLFYHPAVWWVSRRIRQERENCCDDLAVRICGDAAAYARALATLEELRPAPAQLVLAAGGAPLLERIRRLAGQPERTTIRPAWPVAGVVAVLLLVILAAASRNNPASAQPASDSTAINGAGNIGTASNSIAASNASPVSPPVAIVPVNQVPVPPFNQSPATNTVSQTNLAPVSPVNRSSFTIKLKKLSPATNALPLPEINFKTKWVEMDVASVGTNVFAQFFDDDKSRNLTNLPAIFQFNEFFSVRPANKAEAEYQVFLRSNYCAAPLSLVLSGGQSRLALKRLEQQDGVDLLTAPEVTMETGRQAQVQAVDITNIIVGAPGPASTNQQLLPFGPVLDVIPHVSRDRREIELNLVATVTEFVGYEDPATVTNKNGKPMPKGWAIPHFRLRQFSANVPVGNGQTLVLGGGPVPITTKVQMTGKVPMLGDLPLLGHLFRSNKTTTTTVQKVLMLFITPVLVNPDGTRYHAAEEPRPGQSGGLSNAFSRTNLVYTSKGRRAILDKLDKIQVPHIEFDHVPLTEVINKLTGLVKSLDPEKNGINFFISHGSLTGPNGVPGTIDPATGLPIRPAPLDSPDADITSAIININPALNDVRLADVLDAITKTSDIPIKYAVLDYAVVFSLRSQDPAPLEIRTFHIDAKLFRQRLESVVVAASDAGNAPATNSSAGIRRTSGPSEDSRKRDVSIRDFFMAVGVDFSSNNPANVGKAFAWNDRKGVLMVRATAQELDLIAAALDTIASQPHQVVLEVKVAEVGDDFNTTLGFNWTIGEVPPTANLITPQPTNQQSRIKNNPSGLMAHPFPGTVSIGSLEGILTEPQYKVALQALEQREGMEFVGAQQVVTPSGREAEIHLRGESTNAPGRSQFKPTFTVLPTVPGTNEFLIDLNVVSVLPEHGYAATGEMKTDMEGKPLNGLPGYVMPAFQSRHFTNVASVLDGQTLVIGTAIMDRSAEKTNVSVAKHVLIFVTPTIVNPDGTRLHTDAQRAQYLQSIAPAPAIFPGNPSAK